MVVEILVTRGQGEDALRHQCRHIVFDAPGVTIIDKGAGHTPCDVEKPVCFPQQQRTAVGCHAATVESGHDPAPSEAFKLPLLCGTSCGHGDGFLRTFK